MAEFMDTWFKCIFLKPRTHVTPVSMLVRTVVVLLCCSGQASAMETGDTGPADASPGAVQVIKPEVQPRNVAEAAIDDESFEVGVYAGMISIEDFGSQPIIGIRASYFTTEDIFLQLNYALTEAGQTSFERIQPGNNIQLLTDSERDYTYYNMLVGYNIFPGEVFVTSKLAFNSSIYLVGGVGNTEFAGEDNFTTILGTGYRIIVNDWLTWHVDMRDYIFKTDIITDGQVTHNIELSTGVTLFF